MAIAGYAVTLKVSGAAVALTSEEFDATADPEVFRLASGAPLDPATAISVVDGVAPVAAADYTVDYLHGTITFDSAPSSSVYVTGAYLPTLSVGEARSVSLALSWAELDTSVNGTAYALTEQGMKTGSGSLVGLRLTESTIDMAGDLPTWNALHDAGTPKLLEVGLGARKWRGWVSFPGLQTEAPADGVVTSTINFRTVTRRASGRNEVVSYGFGS